MHEVDDNISEATLDLRPCPEVLEHVSPARWAELPTYRFSTVERDLPGQARDYPVARYLGLLCEGAQPSANDVQKFGRAIDALLEKRLMVGVLMAPTIIPLATSVIGLDGITRTAPPRAMLLCYLHSLHDNAALNAELGFAGFVDEGALPSKW